MSRAAKVRSAETTTPLASKPALQLVLGDRYTEEEVATYLGCSTRTLRRMRAEGKVRFHAGLDGRPFYTQDDVRWLLDKMQHLPPESPTGSPTSTPSSVDPAPRRSTSNGARKDGPSDALRAVTILSQPSGAAAN